MLSGSRYAESGTTNAIAGRRGYSADAANDVSMDLKGRRRTKGKSPSSGGLTLNFKSHVKQKTNNYADVTTPKRRIVRPKSKTHTFSQNSSLLRRILSFDKAKTKKKVEIKNKVMVSYCRRNQEFVKKLVAEFDLKSIECWVDWKRIPYGVDWMREIEKGILNCNVFVFCLSPESIESKVCNEEIDYALKCGKRIVPVVVKDGFAWDDVREEIAKINFIFFTGNNKFEERFNQLLQVVETNPEHLTTHTELQRQAMHWERQGKQKEFLLRGVALEDASFWMIEAQKANIQPLPTDLQCNFLVESHTEEAFARRKSAILHAFVDSKMHPNHSASSSNNVIEAREATFSYHHRKLSSVRMDYSPKKPHKEKTQPISEVLFHLRGWLLINMSTEQFISYALILVFLHILSCVIVSSMWCTDSYTLKIVLMAVAFVLSIVSFLELCIQFFIFQGAFIRSSTLMFDTAVVFTITLLQMILLMGGWSSLIMQLCILCILRIARAIGILNSKYKHMQGERNQDTALLVQTTGEAVRLKRIIKNLKFELDKVKRERQYVRVQTTQKPVKRLVTHQGTIESYLNIKDLNALLDFGDQEKYFIYDRRNTEDFKISYWESPANAIMIPPTGTICLFDISQIRQCPTDKKRFDLSFYGPRKDIQLTADTEEIAFRWVVALRKALESTGSSIYSPTMMSPDKKRKKERRDKIYTLDSAANFNPVKASLRTIQSKLVPQEVQEIASRTKEMSKEEKIKAIENMTKRQVRRRRASQAQKRNYERMRCERVKSLSPPQEKVGKSKTFRSHSTGLGSLRKALQDSVAYNDVKSKYSSPDKPQESQKSEIPSPNAQASRRSAESSPRGSATRNVSGETRTHNLSGETRTHNLSRESRTRKLSPKKPRKRINISPVRRPRKAGGGCEADNGQELKTPENVIVDELKSLPQTSTNVNKLTNLPDSKNTMLSPRNNLETSVFTSPKTRTLSQSHSVSPALSSGRLLSSRISNPSKAELICKPMEHRLGAESRVGMSRGSEGENAEFFQPSRRISVTSLSRKTSEVYHIIKTSKSLESPHRNSRAKGHMVKTAIRTIDHAIANADATPRVGSGERSLMDHGSSYHEEKL